MTGSSAQIQEADPSCVLSIPCPNSYYAPPRLTELEPIPEGVRAVLNGLWMRPIHPSRAVRFYLFHSVYVAAEGLVFTEDGRLIDVTRTYHSDNEISVAAAAIAKRPKCPVFPTGILAKSRGSSNYGHFILEMLPRAYLARKTLSLDWPAVIDQVSPDVNRVSKQALQQAGFAQDNIVSIGPSPVFFEKLAVVDGLTSHTQYLSPIVMQCLDDIAGDVVARPHRAIYAARRPATNRDFVNEPDIRANLLDAGYHEFNTDNMPFRDQVAAYKGAEKIIGVMGAALTNIAFSRPGTEVICFMPASACEVLFWMIAEARRLHYREIRCAEFGEQVGNLPWNKDLNISTSQLLDIVGQT